ncbi:MAG: RimK family alpha-L-glutamate ligase [Kiloniellales bacterium]
MSTWRKVALFVERPDWHARRLKKAFAARGWRAVYVPMRDCGFAIGSPSGLALPGFAGRLPELGFVRFIPDGSFEQVTLRLGVLHALRDCGVAVCNDARAIERCVDKSTTSFLLQRAGVPTPPGWVCEQPEMAARIVAREAGPGRPLVLKPLFGSQGRGLKLVEQASELPPPEELDGVYYLQRYVGAENGGWHDYRVLVAGGRPIAAMVRQGKKWITNAKQGAECKGIPLDEKLSGLAIAAAAAVGAAYCGVDIIRARDGGYLVLEVNSMPAWSALQRVSHVDVAQGIVDGVLAMLAGEGAAREVVPA